MTEEHIQTIVFAYYDTEAAIAWFPTGRSNNVVSERVAGGVRDYDRALTN
jgi:hypothetical protein